MLNIDNWPDPPDFWKGPAPGSRQHPLPRYVWPPYFWLRCKVLYNWMPADLTLFGRLRDPWMWPLILFLIVPPADISFFFWLFIYFAIDRTDEYQLMNFALLFRGSAFLSIGVAYCVKGFFSLYVCSSGTFSCQSGGPGVSDSALRSLLFFFGRMLLSTWSHQTLVRVRVRNIEVKRQEAKQEAATIQDATGVVTLPEAVHNFTDVELAMSQWNRRGLLLGALLSVAAVTRGYVVLGVDLNGEEGEEGEAAPHAEISWQTPLLLSFGVCWLFSMLGNVFGAVLMLGRRQVLKLAPQVRAKWSAWTAKRLAGPTPAAARADEEKGVAPLLGTGAAAASEAVDTATTSAVALIQSRARGLRARKATERVKVDQKSNKGSRTGKVGMLTKLFVFESFVFGVISLLFVLDLYLRVGPASLLEKARAPPTLLGYVLPMPLPEFWVFFGLVLSDGLLLHWEVRYAMYTCVAVGSLLAHGPFLVVKIPLIGRKLIGSGVKTTAYDREGNLRPAMSRALAFKKFKAEEEATQKEAAQKEDGHAKAE